MLRRRAITGQNCTHQQSEGRSTTRSVLGGLGRIGLGRVGGVAAAIIPMTDMLSDALINLLDCREQQKASAATEEAVRGGDVGSTSTWTSEIPPGRDRLVDGDRGRRRLHDGDRRRHRRRRGDALRPSRCAGVRLPTAMSASRPYLPASIRSLRLRLDRRLLGAEVASTQTQMDAEQPDLSGKSELVELIREMRFTPQDVNGRQVLLAEGCDRRRSDPATRRPRCSDCESDPGNLAALARRQCPHRQSGRAPHPRVPALPTRIPARLGLLLGLQLPVHGRLRAVRRPRAASSSSTCSPTRRAKIVMSSVRQRQEGEDNTDRPDRRDRAAIGACSPARTTTS